MATGSLCLPRKAGAAPESAPCRERALHSPITGSSSWQPPQSSSRQISAQQSRGKSIVGQSNCPAKLTPFPRIPQRVAGVAAWFVEDLPAFLKALLGGQSAELWQQIWRATASQAGTVSLCPPRNLVNH